MAKANPFDPSDSSLVSVSYSVANTGDALFHSTIASTDSPDYTADKVEANTQCLKLNPHAVEEVVVRAAPTTSAKSLNSLLFSSISNNRNWNS